jgi:diguanylate cyclase (GGDEF)-like protein/PAS domain S-box-containing protein
MHSEPFPLNWLSALDEATFVPLSRLAARICAAPMSVVGFAAAEHQGLTAVTGMDAAQGRQLAQRCLQELALPQAGADAPCRPPLVHGGSPVRFVACVPLLAPGGRALGVLAVFDRVLRTPDPQHMESLATLAQQAQLQLALRQQQWQYRQLFDDHPQPMWVYEPETLRLLAVNRATVRLYGYSEEELLRMGLDDLWLPEERARHRAELLGVQRGAPNSVPVRRHRCKDGSVIDVEIFAGPVQFNGRPARQSMVTDVTQRRRAEHAQQRLQATVLKVAAAVSASTGTEFFEQLVLNMAEALGAQTGCVARLLPGEPPRAAMLARCMDGAKMPTIEYPLAGTPSFSLLTQRQFVVARDIARLYPLAPTLMERQAQAYAGQQLCNADGQPIGMVYVLFRDPLAKAEEDFVTSMLQFFAARAAAEMERLAAEREIQRLAFYDLLTGLPNRMLLMDRINHALAAARRSHQGGALLFIDLDNFKDLNDTLGHDKGDLLLQQVAQRLNDCVRGMDTVARLGGDEFVVMIEQLSGDPADLSRAARIVAEKILARLSAPYTLAGHQYLSTPSIGIAPFHGDGGPMGTSVGELLQQADLAMYQAKAAGRATLCFFDPGMQAAAAARAGLEADLRTALAQGDFVLHYQPQVDHAGRAVGVEALVRWRHPQRGMVSPADFIPLAEDTGLILPLGRWVLRTACELLAQWREDPRLAHLSVAVNVSSRQFHNADFADYVAHVLRNTGAPPARLKLELTESMLVHDMVTTIARMEALRALGVGFALDDFGTGYSSLAYLRRMPLDQIKIDRSFVRELLTDANDAAIVNTIIALSRSLGLEVIAEGVETAEQRDLLARAGCRFYQGYLFGKPVAEEALMPLLGAVPA